MKRILVPTNFSTQAGWAIEVATYLTRRSNAELVLLHVVEYPATESFDAESEGNDLEHDVQGALLRKLTIRNRMYLNELESNLSAIGISVIKVIRKGNLLHAIKTVVFDYNIDLVVMGTTRRSKIEEVLDKSRTEQVVKFSQAPVLAVREKPSRNQFRNIVYATSLSSNGTALPEILTNAERLYGAKVHIATVNTPKLSRTANELEKEMEGFARKYKLENYSINILNDKSEDAGIVRFAERIGADLIVIATHGRKELSHEIQGNIPQDLVNHSSIPVLTYLG